jgi:hypothetical protein
MFRIGMRRYVFIPRFLPMVLGKFISTSPEETLQEGIVLHDIAFKNGITFAT